MGINAGLKGTVCNTEIAVDIPKDFFICSHITFNPSVQNNTHTEYAVSVLLYMWEPH